MTIIRDTTQILTPEQIAELDALYVANRDETLQTTGGLWAPVYEKLYSFITDFYDDNEPSTDRPKEGIDPQTWLWLRGARFINAGTGLMAALIRDYTIIQYRLRYGQPVTQEQMDEASNNIARRFLGQWLGYNVKNDDYVTKVDQGTQPDIEDAAQFDAGPAAAVVFNLDDPEFGDAAGWAGTLLWGNLGDPKPWQDMVLSSLQNPLLPGQLEDLPETQDIGSYNAIAAAAAVEHSFRIWRYQGWRQRGYCRVS